MHLWVGIYSTGASHAARNQLLTKIQF